MPARDGKTALVAEYKIDTESAWHIRSRKSSIVGSADRYYPAGKDTYKGSEDDDWSRRRGENRYDERLKKFIKRSRSLALVAEFAEANAWGGLTINLSKGYAIETFQHITVGEYWRMFHSANKREKHFAVTELGVKMQ